MWSPESSTRNQKQKYKKRKLKQTNASAQCVTTLDNLFVFKSNQILFEDTVANRTSRQPALTEALNTIKDETKQHKIHKLNELYGNICKWSQYTIIKLMKNTKGAIYV